VLRLNSRAVEYLMEHMSVPALREQQLSVMRDQLTVTELCELLLRHPSVFPEVVQVVHEKTVDETLLGEWREGCRLLLEGGAADLFVALFGHWVIQSVPYVTRDEYFAAAVELVTVFRALPKRKNGDHKYIGLSYHSHLIEGFPVALLEAASGMTYSEAKQFFADHEALFGDQKHQAGFLNDGPTVAQERFNVTYPVYELWCSRYEWGADPRFLTSLQQKAAWAGYTNRMRPYAREAVRAMFTAAKSNNPTGVGTRIAVDHLPVSVLMETLPMRSLGLTETLNPEIFVYALRRLPRAERERYARMWWFTNPEFFEGTTVLWSAAKWLFHLVSVKQEPFGALFTKKLVTVFETERGNELGVEFCEDVLNDVNVHPAVLRAISREAVCSAAAVAHPRWVSDTAAGFGLRFPHKWQNFTVPERVFWFLSLPDAVLTELLPSATGPVLGGVAASVPDFCVTHPFWGVRVAAAKTVGVAGLKVLAVDLDSRVREAAAGRLIDVLLQ
jgi:hypothetical protein